MLVGFIIILARLYRQDSIDHLRFLFIFYKLWCFFLTKQVLLGIKYNPTADIWSFACMIFEMLTGDFLFEPRKGPEFSKNEDHLA